MDASSEESGDIWVTFVSLFTLFLDIFVVFHDEEESETLSSNKQRLKCFGFLSLISCLILEFAANVGIQITKGIQSNV